MVVVVVEVFTEAQAMLVLDLVVSVEAETEMVLQQHWQLIKLVVLTPVVAAVVVGIAAVHLAMVALAVAVLLSLDIQQAMQLT
jgi:hypothetical protein